MTQAKSPYVLPVSSLPKFPVDDLGAPLRASYRYAVDMGLTRTPFDSGATRQRRRYTTQPTVLSLAWDFNTQQVARFAAFADALGYSWFAMDLPTLQTPGDILDPPIYLTVTELRFSTNYVVSATGFDRFKVELGAEIASLRSLQDFLRMYWSDDGAEFYFADDGGRIYGRRV